MRGETLLMAARRLAAYAIDVTLLFSVLGGLQWAASKLVGFPSWEGLGENALNLEGWVLLTVSLPSWLYFILSDLSKRQATLGKRLLGLQVGDLGGQRIGTGRAILRTACKLFPWELTHFSVLVPIPLLLPDAEGALSQMAGLILANVLIVAYLVALFVSGGKRSIHDLIAGTTVSRRAG